MLLDQIIELYEGRKRDFYLEKEYIPVIVRSPSGFSSFYTVSDVKFKDEDAEDTLIGYMPYTVAKRFCTEKDFTIEGYEKDSSFVISENDFEKDLNRYTIESIADRLREFGLRKKCIIWFLFNYQSIDSPLYNIDITDWGEYGFTPSMYSSLYAVKKSFYEYCEEISEDINRRVKCLNRKKRLDLFKEQKEIDSFIHKIRELGYQDDVFVIDKVENHLGELVGYKKIDIENRIVKVEEVLCWSSSWLGLGCCNCVNHDYSYSYERELNSYDVEELFNILKEERDIERDILKIIRESDKIKDKNNIKIIGGSYRDFDNYIEFIVEGEKVKVKEVSLNCYSSSQLGFGTCNCITHLPYYETIRGPSKEDLVKIQDFLSNVK